MTRTPLLRDRRRIRTTSLLGALARALPLLAFAGTARGALCDPSQQPLAPLVILVTLDGFPNTVLRDPTAALPQLRALRAAGFCPADGLVVANPSTTWANHTSLITGVLPAEHGVLLNGKVTLDAAGLPERPDPRATRAELVRCPTLCEATHAAGLSVAAINWPATRGAPEPEDLWPDTPESVAQMSPSLRADLVQAGIIRPVDYPDLRAMFGAARDAVRVEAACFLLRHRPPRLLLLHLSNTDGIQHEYGPHTPAAATAYAWADALIGQLVRTLEQTGLMARTTLIIASDHGFSTPAQTLLPDNLLRCAGYDPDSTGNTGRRVRVVCDGGCAFIHFSPRPDAKELATAAALFRGQPGIADVVTPERFPTFGYPEPTRHPEMASIVLLAEDTFAFGRDANRQDWVTSRLPNQNRGTHGWPSYQPSMHAIFVAVGPGIQPAAPSSAVTITDVAPTIARILGLDFPTAHGRPIKGVAPVERERR